MNLQHPCKSWASLYTPGTTSLVGRVETEGSLAHWNPNLSPGSVRNPAQGHKTESYREGLLMSSYDFCTCVGTPHIQCMWAMELACGPAVPQLGPMFSSRIQPPFKPSNSPMILLFPPHSLMLLTWCLEIGTRRWMGRAQYFSHTLNSEIHY